MLKNARIVFFGLIAALVWALLSTGILVSLGYNDILRVPEERDVYPFWYAVFFVCVWAPIWEEAAYRYGPLEIAKRTDKKYVIPVAVMVSCFFGWGHGDCPEGVLIQGVLGFIFSLVYIYTNYNYWCSVIVHSLYNIVLVFGPTFLRDTLQ